MPARKKPGTTKKKYNQKRKPFLGHLDHYLIKRICILVEQGNRIDSSCKCLGLTLETLHNWLKKGREAIKFNNNEKSVQIYIKLVKEFDRAVGRAEQRDVERIDQAANLDWKAAAWKLTHGVNREHWMDKTGIEHSGPGGGPIESVQGQIDYSKLDLPLEVKEQMLTAMEKQREERKKLEHKDVVDVEVLEVQTDGQPGEQVQATEGAPDNTGEPGPSEPIEKPKVRRRPAAKKKPLQDS